MVAGVQVGLNEGREVKKRAIFFSDRKEIAGRDIKVLGK